MKHLIYLSIFKIKHLALIFKPIATLFKFKLLISVWFYANKSLINSLLFTLQFRIKGKDMNCLYS